LIQFFVIYSFIYTFALLVFSRNISELATGSETIPEELEWRVVAATQMGEKSIMALTVINGRMTNLSVLQRLNAAPNGAR
jgi:hypothetical protein